MYWSFGSIISNTRPPAPSTSPGSARRNWITPSSGARNVLSSISLVSCATWARVAPMAAFAADTWARAALTAALAVSTRACCLSMT
ncbi:hypothetical protein D3C84_1099030 [compost metagenome]